MIYKLKTHLILMVTVVLICGMSSAFADGGHAHSANKHKAEGEAHAHASPHGGIVKTIGTNHVELVFAKDTGQLELYILGSDTKTESPISAREIKGQLKVTGSDKYQPVSFMALDPNSSGESSHYKAKEGSLTNGASFQLALKIPIGEETFRAVFKVENDLTKSSSH